VSYLDAKFTRWAAYIAANVVLDTAFTVFFEAAVDSKYEPLRQRAVKIVQEESAHWVHGSGWLRRLSDVQPSLEAVWDDAFTWFGRDDDPVLGPLTAAGLLSRGPDALREALRTRLEPL